jgi:hypothetical protein
MVSAAWVPSGRRTGPWSDHRLLLLVTIAALVTAWWITPDPLPIYNGVGNPDEPYRYVETPPGESAGTSRPGRAEGSAPAQGGVNAGSVGAASDEIGAQVSAFVPSGGLTVPRGATSVTMRLAPMAPDSASVGALGIEGNVYRLTLSTDRGTAVRVTPPGTRPWIDLRAVQPPPPLLTMVYRPSADDDWRALETNLVGAHHYGARILGGGDYALARTSPPSAEAGAGLAERAADNTGGRGPNVPLVVVSLVLSVVLTAAIIRVLRHRPAP